MSTPRRTSLRWPLALALLIAVGCKEHPSKLDQVATKRPADAAVAQTLDEQLEAIRAKLKLPALAMAAWRDGTLLEIGAVGLRRADAPEKVTTKDAWHLGSNGCRALHSCVTAGRRAA